MRIAASVVMAVMLMAIWAPGAGAQPPPRPYMYSSSGSVITSSRPTTTTLRFQSTVAVPDGGTATLGGLSSSSMGRNEGGVPGLGKLPVGGRGFRNIGYGRSVSSTRASIRVRVIDLREEEYRQTGYRSR
jgi:type II secretory pathway component GspD/PulD (secretin)